MKANSIRGKLLLLTLLPPLIMLAVILGYFIHQDNRLINEALIERGHALSRYLASSAEYGVITGNTEQLAHISETIVQGDVVALRVYDFDGVSILSRGEEVVARAADRGTDISGLCGGNDSFLLFCAPILLGNVAVSDYEPGIGANATSIIGRIELTLSKRLIDQKRATMLTWSMLLVLVLIALAFIMSRRTERQLVEPLTSLGRVVDRVRNGDLQVKVSEGATGELLALQQGVNVMIDSLAQSHQTMQREIDSATENLRQAFQQLELQNQQLQKEQQRAESASLAKSQFLATMSHEIRTPLGGMVGMLQLLRDGTDSRHQLDCIDSLESAAQSLRHLIDDILDFSRLEVGKLALHNQLFAPLAIVEEVMVMMTPSAHHKGLEFVLDVGEGLPREVMGDPLRFRQILINLTANAIKFTQEGEVVVRVRSKQDADRCCYRFEICDSGIGISKDKQALVFESFTQIDEGDARNYGGSGLGTTVSRELVRMMEGDIGLESELGRGSCFWFELPWQCGEAPDEHSSSVTEQTLLLLERQTASAEAITSLMVREQIAVQRVEDEPALWQALSAQEYNWVMIAEDGAASEWRPLLERLAVELPAATHLVQLCYVNGIRSEEKRVEHLNKPLLPSALDKLLHHVRSVKSATFSDQAPPQLSVLLAEDDEINAKVITHFLEQGGHQVERVVDGDAALRALRKGKFDCVLMDIRMPGLDGLEATRRWRAEERGRSMPIIALTANSSEEDRLRCREVGMDDYLTKPVESSTLLATLYRLCS